ncbi:MAG TPA: hypothetical protein VHJ20_09280 [Polyangia bacterium]|nr:hypothetical protein [Polyangia bacterium]
MSGRGVVILAAVVVAAAGCANRKDIVVDFSETPRDYVTKDYERVYERWTRHEAVLRDVDVALEAWATFKSWDFREAYVEHYADVYSLSDADRKTLREAQRDAFHAAYEFHVTAQSADYRWNDLERESSPWRVTLVDALGHELSPEYVRVEKLPDVYEHEFFPSKTPFSKTYAIRFPAGADHGDFVGLSSGSIVLRIASPAGRLELRWHAS